MKKTTNRIAPSDQHSAAASRSVIRPFQAQWCGGVVLAALLMLLVGLVGCRPSSEEGKGPDVGYPRASVAASGTAPEDSPAAGGRRRPVRIVYRDDELGLANSALGTPIGKRVFGEYVYDGHSRKRHRAALSSYFDTNFSISIELPNRSEEYDILYDMHSIKIWSPENANRIASKWGLEIYSKVDYGIARRLIGGESEYFDLDDVLLNAPVKILEREHYDEICDVRVIRLAIDAKEVGDRYLPGESFEVWLSVPDGLHIRTIYPPSLGSRDIRCVSLEFDVPVSDKDFRITGLPRSAATMTNTLDVLSPQDPLQRQESVLRGRVKLLPITTQAVMYSREIHGPGSEKELLDRLPVLVETGWLLLQLVPIARGEECRLYAADPTVGLAVHRPNHRELWPMIGQYYTTEPHQTPTPPQPLQTESGQLLQRAPSDSSFMWDVGKVRYLLLCPKKIAGSKALEIARLTHEVGTAGGR